MSANEYEFKFVNKKAALQLIEDKVIKIADLACSNTCGPVQSHSRRNHLSRVTKALYFLLFNSSSITFKTGTVPNRCYQFMTFDPVPLFDFISTVKHKNRS